MRGKKDIETQKQNALLLNMEDLPKRTHLRVNLEPNTIIPYALMARDIRIKPMLKPSLYDKIITDWINDSLEGKYKAVFEEYIVPIMCYYTVYYLCTLHAVQITEQGMQSVSAGNADAVDLQDAEKIAKRYNTLADEMLIQFEKYMDGANIPEYNSDYICQEKKYNYNLITVR